MPTHSTHALDVTAHVTASIVPAVLDVLGQRWSLAIIQALLLREKTFGQLLQELNIPRSSLSARLKHLQAMHCLEASTGGYQLTEAGQALLPIASLAQAWDSPLAAPQPSALFVHTCGQRMAPKLVCVHCDVAIRASDIHLDSPGERPDLGRLPKPLRRSRAEFSLDKSLSAAEILGDRWTALIVALGFYGVQRYSDIERQLAIAPNILADRLQRLCVGEVLVREGPRYRFSERGLQLFPLIVALTEWGDQWLRAEGQAPTQMRHLPCDHVLRSALHCDCCGRLVDLGSLSVANETPA